MPAQLGIFGVKDWEFSVSSAQLWADIEFDGTLHWTFELFTDEGPEGLSPTACFGEIPWRPKTISDFTRLAVYVPDGERFSSGRIMPGFPMCVVGFSESEHLRHSEFRITGYTGSKLDVTWNGRFDLRFSDEYGLDLPMKIRTQASFIGLEVPWEDESEAREKAAAYFDVTDMQFHQVPDDTGAWLITDSAEP